MIQEVVTTETKSESKLYHLISLITLSGLFTLERLESKNSILNNALYLSFFSFYINLFYYYISFVSDLSKVMSKESLNPLFNFCFNISFTASIIYWSIYSLDTWNVLEKYPPVLTFFLHGGIFLMDVLELLYFNPRKNKTILENKYIICFMGIYPISLRLVYTYTDYSIDFFYKYNMPQFMMTCIFASILFLLAHFVYKLITYEKEQREDDIQV